MTGAIPQARAPDAPQTTGRAGHGRVGVMQLTDSLLAAGLERVAVNLANNLPSDRYRSYLCTTRQEGPLAQLIAPDVGRLCLARRWSLDMNALRRLVSYVRQNRIQVLHAHGTTLFIAVLASLLRPHPRVIWHNHGGWMAVRSSAPLAIRLFATRTAATLVVNRHLVDWCSRVLGLPARQVRYVPNFVIIPNCVSPACGLPGQAGSRIVSVANLLPPKDPVNLLRAMKIVAEESPTAHLLIVGRPGVPAYMEKVRRELADPVLQGRVSILGVRTDVASVLKASDIGVLASATEGFPLALLEYGMAGLPTVATRVGQCEEVLSGGFAGLLVPPSAPEELARALLSLLQSPTQRVELGRRFRTCIQHNYGAERAMQQVCDVYESILIPSDGVG